MKIAIGQMNPRIADFERNCEKILNTAHEAAAQGADLVVTPELSICGYPPMDLLDQPGFLRENLRSLRYLQKNLPGTMGVLVGLVDKSDSLRGKALQNVMVLLYQGKVIHRQAKTLLPTYDVFDEARYFAPARSWQPVIFKDHSIGIAICEDMWWETERDASVRYEVDPVNNLLNQGIDLLIVPSASPFYQGKANIRLGLMEHIGRSSGVPVVYVNTVGANDNLIFDGHSLVTGAHGQLIHSSSRFKEDLSVIDPFSSLPTLNLPLGRDQELADVKEALELGIRDYLHKSGFTKIHLGLSGGIDSAVVAVLAVGALGPENVIGFLLPSQYSSEGSVTDSQILGKNLGIALKTIAIEPMYTQFEQALEPHFDQRPPDLAEENIQARIRGTLLMAYSNKFGSLVLTTGNKSELAVGYCTLYGDMAGSLAVIGDLFKTEVYELARFINREQELIPQAIIEKPPSAELRPDQKDQDSLPPYDLLDGMLREYLLNHKTKPELISMGYEPELVSRILTLVAASEYKRRQAPPVLKVSPRAFGTGRRIPIARAFSENRWNIG